MQLRTSSILGMVVLTGMFILGFWQIMERSALVYGETLTQNVTVFDNAGGIQSDGFNFVNDLMTNPLKVASSIVNVFVAGVDVVLIGMVAMFDSISLMSTLLLTAGGIIQMPQVIIDALSALITIGILYGIISIKSGGGKV